MFTYIQDTGKLYKAIGVLFGAGYSGAADGKNNPDMQDVPCVGPIPRGDYVAGEPFDSPAHGPFAMHLVPDPANEMFGRSGFLMHGDSLEHPGCASEGCIIMPHSVRTAFWASGDHAIVVGRLA